MSQTVAEPGSLIGQRVFGGYIVTRQIGAGGIGAVYEAENPELRTKLALKVLLPERSANKTIVKRFTAEARAASAIAHRNIVQIIDAGQLEGGAHYILMEYLEGETLQQYERRKGRAELPAALSMLAQVCSGLEATHARGIIHRDLKPANLIVSPQPDNPLFVKILDFGIAKLTDEALAEGFQTRTEASAGTPNYMSPEQARALRDVDHRTDLYSLGVIAYELLTGQLPYRAHSIGELAYQHSIATPAAPRQLRPEIPPAWNEAIGRAIAIEPMERQANVREFAMELIESLDGGEDIARRVAPLLFQAPPREQTAAMSMPDLTAGAHGQVSQTVDVTAASEVSPFARASTPVTVADVRASALPPPSVPEALAAAPPVSKTGASMTEHVQPRRSRLWWGAAALLAVGAGVGAVALLGGDDEPARVASAPGPGPAPVQAAPIVVQPMAQETNLGIATTPAGATVRVDGALVPGQTPVTVQVADGATVEIEVSLAGHETLVETVMATGASRELSFSLHPVPAAPKSQKKRAVKPRKDKPRTKVSDDEMFDTRK